MSVEKSGHGYVDRIRDCGCVVGVIADEPEYAQSVAEFVSTSVRAGRYCDRLSVVTIRKLRIMAYCESCRAEGRG